MFLYHLIPSFIRRQKWLKKFYQREQYELLSRILKNDKIKFLNLGYVPDEKEMLLLIPEDEPERLCIQLYHYLLKETDLKNKDVLEVGCGRGGGCYYFVNYLDAEKVTGIDIASGNIKFCKENYPKAQFKFLQAEAETFSLSDGSFDVVVNVESSHCYTSREAFVKNVSKALKPGGYFVYADMLTESQFNEMETFFKNEEFSIVRKRNITPNVLSAIDIEEERKKAVLLKRLPKFLAREFGVFKDSDVYKGMKSGSIKYFHYLLQKSITFVEPC